MVSQDKLIKQGIKYTDALFDEISKRLEKGVLDSDTLESFLEKTKDYTTANPLGTTGYDKKMLDIILAETNNHKFSRPAQKELVRVTIENQVGELIRDVGDDIKDSVRDIVKQGYNEGLSQDKIAENISNKVSAIKGKRAKAIARTEIARTATISDYVINAERGATHYYVECRNTACPVCKQRWLSNPPTDVPGKKGLIGDKKYPMTDTANLPPVHPNCRCVVYFTIEDDGKSEVPEPTPEQLKGNLKPGEREKYNQYIRNIERQRDWLRNNPDASSDEIAKHQKRLKFLEGKFDELRRKALGGKVKGEGKPKTTPKPKSESEPKKPKEPKTPKKPTDEPELANPTKEQLDKNLTKKEREEWKNHKTEVDWANRVLNDSNSTDKQKNYAQKRLNEILPRYKELNKKALGLTSKTTLKEKTKKKNKPKKKEKAEVELDKPKNTRLTKEEADSLTFEQLAEHHEAEYKGLVKRENDGKEYHVFEQKFDNGETFTIYFEKGAVTSYKKGEVATANEIIHEVFKVPETLRKETNEIWFKNTQKGIRLKPNGKFDTIGKNVGGYNTSRIRSLRRDIVKDQSTKFKGYTDPNHRIVINPKSFKKLKDFLDIITWRDTGGSITSWKHIIHHEFIHSIDDSRKIWREGLPELHKRDDYVAIDKEENYFTKYANNMISESFAEHGGYISYMLANPDEQDKKLSIHHYGRDENNKIISIEEKITFKEYKERYPKHYDYFINLIKNGAD